MKNNDAIIKLLIEQQLSALCEAHPLVKSIVSASAADTKRIAALEKRRETICEAFQRESLKLLHAKVRAEELEDALQGMLDAFGSCKNQPRPVWRAAIAEAEKAMKPVKGFENDTVQL